MSDETQARETIDWILRTASEQIRRRGTLPSLVILIAPELAAHIWHLNQGSGTPAEFRLKVANGSVIVRADPLRYPGGALAREVCGCGGLFQWTAQKKCDACLKVEPKAATRSVVPVAPRPVLHDGLTSAQCLERFIVRQRESVLMWSGPGPSMTPAQLTAARTLWSQQLRAKVAATRSTDRAREVTVVVEEQG